MLCICICILCILEARPTHITYDNNNNSNDNNKDYSADNYRDNNLLLKKSENNRISNRIISETLVDNGVMPNNFLRIGLKSGFSSIVGSQKYLRKCYGLDAESISSKIIELFNK